MRERFIEAFQFLGIRNCAYACVIRTKKLVSYASTESIFESIIEFDGFISFFQPQQLSMAVFSFTSHLGFSSFSSNLYAIGSEARQISAKNVCFIVAQAAFN